MELEEQHWLYVAMASAALFIWGRLRGNRNKKRSRSVHYQRFILGAARDGKWHDVTDFQARFHHGRPFFEAYWMSLVYEWLVYRDLLEEAGNPIDGDAPFVRITDTGRRKLASLDPAPT